MTPTLNNLKNNKVVVKIKIRMKIYRLFIPKNIREIDIAPCVDVGMKIGQSETPENEYYCTVCTEHSWEERSVGEDVQ
jgi:hypothetical protein